MTKLECSVKNCIRNADNCCCKTTIAVGGSKAKSSGQTCCIGFDENKGARFTNLFGAPETRLKIACDTIKCVYNEEHHYFARHIDISGDGACDCTETKCNTSKARQGCRGCHGSGVSPISMWDGRRGRKRIRGDRGL